MSAHDYTGAEPITTATLDGVDTYTGVNYYTPWWTGPEAPPPAGVVLRGYRAGWWTFVPGPKPGGARTTALYAYGWDGPVYLDVWRADTDTGWTLVGQAQSATAGADTVKLTGPYTTGVRHYARVATVADVEQESTHLQVEGIYPLDAPTGGGGGGTPVALTAGPADVTLDAPAVALTVTTAPAGIVAAAGPADTILDAPAPTTAAGTAEPIAPAGTTVPGVRPAFTVAATATGPGQLVEVQWSTDPTFTTPAAGTAAAAAPAGLDDAQVSVTPSVDLPDGIVWWRARLTGPFGPGTWSTAVSFAVNPLEGQAVAAGALTVTTAAAAVPHLWYIDHDETGADTGEPAVIIGTGFGPAPAVMLGAEPCGVDEVLVVPADPANDTDPRIEPGVACTPWHEQITFTIPTVDADHVGDAVTVQRS